MSNLVRPPVGLHFCSFKFNGKVSDSVFVQTSIRVCGFLKKVLFKNKISWAAQTNVRLTHSDLFLQILRLYDTVSSSSLPLLLLYSHSLWGASYRGLGKSTLFVSAVIGWDERSCVSVPITSSSAGCRKREGVGELESERKEEGSENGELRLLGTPGREGRHYPSIVKTGNTGRAGGWRGVGVTHWKGYRDCRGFIRVNKSLLYMAQWRCPKETEPRTGTKSERSLIIQREMKAEPWIHLTKMRHLYVCK